MRKARRALRLVVVFAIVAVLATPTFAAPGDITLASTDDAGTNGNAPSIRESLSADGTKVAFDTASTNLDPGDTDSVYDVYVKDLTTGDITLASTNDAGTKGNDGSGIARLSADGTKVAFDSIATNLDPGDTDSNEDLYVKDLATGDITLASTDDAGTKGNGASGVSSLSADGTKVAFYSAATNLDPGDTDSDFDVYVKDLTTGDITLASTNDAGTKGNDGSALPSLSADGTMVAFDSIATNLDPGDTDSNEDVYVKNLTTGDITLASTDDAGTKGNGASGVPSLSADGTKVAFYSAATNLDPGDTDPDYDVYVKDLTTGDITLASTNDAGTKGNAASTRASLSADGTKVAFDTTSTNLDPGDTDPDFDVYVKDLTTGEIILASTNDAGTKGNAGSGISSLSADGAKVAFDSAATNLDPGDTDSDDDIYVKEVPVAPSGTADLSLKKNDRRDPVRVGGHIRYTITVHNLGLGPATGVKVVDELPAGVSFVSATSLHGNCSQAAGVVTCTYESKVKAGGKRIVTIVVAAPSTPGSISNTARVTANERDPALGNNQDTEKTHVI